jgi:hypothetical protein
MLTRALFFIHFSSSPPRRTNKVVTVQERGDSLILSKASISKRVPKKYWVEQTFKIKRIIEYFLGTYRKISKTSVYILDTNMFSFLKHPGIHGFFLCLLKLYEVMSGFQPLSYGIFLIKNSTLDSPVIPFLLKFPCFRFLSCKLLQKRRPSYLI